MNFVFSQICELFPAVTITGSYNSLEQDLDLNLGTVTSFEQKSIFDFCKSVLQSNGDQHTTIDIEFKKKYSLIFQNIGEGNWIIVGGKNLLNNKVMSYLSELDNFNSAKSTELIGQVSPIIEKSEGLPTSSSGISDRLPAIWENSQIVLSEDEMDYKAVRKGQYKQRRKQILNLYKDIESAGLEKVFNDYFVFSNLKLESSNNFYWYKEIEGIRYAFLVKSMNPNIDRIVHYSDLATYISGLDEAHESKKLYSKVKEMVANMALGSYEDGDEEDVEDSVGVFRFDGDTMEVDYACNGFYFLRIPEDPEDAKMEKFDEKCTYYQGQKSLKSGDKCFFFSNEVIERSGEDTQNSKQKFKDFLLNFCEDMKISMQLFKKRLDESYGVQLANDDLLLTYTELK